MVTMCRYVLCYILWGEHNQLVNFFQACEDTHVAPSQPLVFSHPRQWEDHYQRNERDGHLRFRPLAVAGGVGPVASVQWHQCLCSELV
jgi:hypothetical protein